jgi:hypothetical protein
VSTVADRWWVDDDRLLAVLKEALGAAHAVPREFVEAGKAAYAWRTIDAELAALTYDSAGDAGVPSAATRADPAALRALTFASAHLTIELEITPDAVLGQLTPAQAGSVSAHVGAGEVASAPIDELGFFIVSPVPTQSFRLLCQTTSGDSSLTGWISP